MYRRSVVFVDDDEDLLLFLRHILEPTGIETHCYSTHRETLENIEEVFPGIVFIDYQMVEGNGITLLNQLKQILPLAKMIMLTGEGNELVAVRAMKAGADDYLVKPIEPGLLLRVVDQYFQEYFSILLNQNGKYLYPTADQTIARYEFLRAAYSGIVKSIKTVCKFFTYSRQDFYNYDRRFKMYGPAGLMKKKDFERLPSRYTTAKNPRRKIHDLDDFIDMNDDVQVKLEMIREAATTPRPNICEISHKFGFTREAFYQIYRRFQIEGLMALPEKKKGRPRRGYI